MREEGEMINKIICYIIGCKMKHEDKFYPSICAPIVTKWEHKSACSRCNNIEEFIWRHEEDGM
jgi:hypothetical protein